MSKSKTTKPTVAPATVAPATVWERARDLRDETEKLSLDARETGEHELAEGLGRAYRELTHPSVQSYDPQNRTK